MEPVQKVAFKELPLIKTKGRPAIDWAILYHEWLESGMDPDCFIEQYGLDPKSPRVRKGLRNWDRAGEQAEVAQAIETLDKLASGEAVVEIVQEEDKVIAEDWVRVWKMIRSWRARQCEQDYLLTDKLRLLIEDTIERLSQSSYIKTYDLVNLAKALETAQRIQRLSLGLSTDNVGVEDARKLAEESTMNEKDIDDSTPTFIVEVSEGGKFKRLRPRQIR